MLSTRVDVKSGQQIDVPTDDAGVLKLGENVVRAEELLPTAKQFPRLDLIRQRLQAGKVGLDKFYAARADGSAVSVSVEQGLVDAKAAVQKIISGLTYLHLHELPVLEQWGIDVRQTSRGPKTQTPRKQGDILEMLRRYREKEQSLPETDRLPSPTLLEVTAIYTRLVEALDQRSAANTEQEQGYLLRTTESKSLLNLLLLAAHYHVIVDFEGKVDARLQSLGFNVVAVPPKASKPTSAETTPDQSA